MTQGKSVLELTTRIGEVLLKNGGEIFRVQQTMQIVAKAYGVSGFHVYVLANGLFVSIEEDGKQLCSQVGQNRQSRWLPARFAMYRCHRSIWAG